MDERRLAAVIASLYVLTVLQPVAADDPERRWAQPPPAANEQPAPFPPTTPAVPAPAPAPERGGWVQPTAAEPAAPAAESGEATTTTSPPRRWAMPEAQATPVTQYVGTQGSFLLELAGATAGALLGIGLLLAGVFAVIDHDSERTCESCSALLAFGIGVLVLGPPLGVTIAGNASGGEGSFGWALVGTLAGFVLSAPGMVAGAIIGYRASAPDRPSIPAASILPTPDLHGAQLHISVRF